MRTRPTPSQGRARRRWRRLKRRWAFPALVVVISVLAGVVIATLG